jgi:hypothetical protein
MGGDHGFSCAIKWIFVVAVLIAVLAIIAFEKEVEYEHGLGFLTNWAYGKMLAGKVARFGQVNKDKPNVHHDALEFPDGQIVLVTRLSEGQHATVASRTAHRD